QLETLLFQTITHIGVVIVVIGLLSLSYYLIFNRSVADHIETGAKKAGTRVKGYYDDYKIERQLKEEQRVVKIHDGPVFQKIDDIAKNKKINDMQTFDDEMPRQSESFLDKTLDLLPFLRKAQYKNFPEIDEVVANENDTADVKANIFNYEPDHVIEEMNDELEMENTTTPFLDEVAPQVIAEDSRYVGNFKSTPTFEASTYDEANYRLPSNSMLKFPPKSSGGNRKTIAAQNVERLEQTFKNFNLKVSVSDVNIGPSVTQYEVVPEPGVKVSRIVNLSDDLALALAAKQIRIEAPIPGKSAIGIEVPNLDTQMVSLRELLEDAPIDNRKLLVGLGRDVSGQIITAELNKMPHVLVAGATGSGKSVCINTMITSVLMRSKPSEVKFLLIDPKKVELTMFDALPHLLAPVVTDPKKAAVALKKVVVEMEERYNLFAENGVKNIEGYNQKVENQAIQDEKMPFIVVVIDELADLMLVASREVEDSIMRLAQMARAAGIHMIIATQRPSVDVITGVIKSNIPSRIAFGVSSQIDSRTILDMGGAEKLLGKGDMLYFPTGQPMPLRVQGAYLGEDEIQKVVTFIKKQASTQYREDLVNIDVPQQDDMNGNNSANDDDPLFEEAIAFVRDTQKASASLLQRRFRVGYNRAARMIDDMEAKGIISASDGSKPREVIG
ncbi:MAG: DNA translocase FtsK, partial [Culicoidibacterales bacterium]